MYDPKNVDLLLVDDDSEFRELAARRFIRGGYQVQQAANGEEAVLLAAKLKPAAVVMDIHLPVLSGVPATTLIKINNPFTAVIGLTAGDPQQDEKAMSIAGAALVLNKSEVLHTLYPAIVAAVKRVKNPV